MVPVGDEDGPAADGGLDGGEAGRIVDPLDAVDDPVVVDDGAERLAGLEQQLGQPGGEGQPPDGGEVGLRWPG